MLLYEYLVVFISLTAFLDPVRSNNSSDSDGCVQKTKNDHCCQLPFVHEGETYYSCTKVDSGLYWIYTYYWCYYDQLEKKYEKCKEPIYHPPRSTPSETKPTKQQIFQSSSMLNVAMTTTSNLVSQIPRSSIGISSPSSSTTTVLARSETETRPSSTTKQNVYIILACGIGGGVLLTVIIALTVIIYFKRKRKIKVSKEEQENEQEMNRYKLTVESNNPVYESIDKDLDIQSNEEQQALKSPHVYHELEDPQSPTSCSHEYDAPYYTSKPNSNGPETTPALNETDGGFIHENELYEAI